MDTARCCCESLRCELKEVVKSKEILQEEINSLSNTLSLYRQENVKFVDSTVRYVKEMGDLERKLVRTERTHEFRRVRALKKAQEIHELRLILELKKAEEAHKSLLVQELRKAEDTHELLREEELKKAEETHKSLLVQELKKSEEAHKSLLVQELKKSEETHKSLLVQELKKAEDTHELLRVEELKKAEETHKSRLVQELKKAEETHKSLLVQELKKTEKAHEFLLTQIETERNNYSKKLEDKNMQIDKLLKDLESETLMKTNSLVVVDHFKTAAHNKSNEIYKLNDSLELLEEKRKNDEKLFFKTFWDLQVLNFKKDEKIMELRNALKEKSSTIV